MACISRYANKKFIQKFGDGKHIFYFEFRCNRPCLEKSKYCKFCQNKSRNATHQFFLCFDHGDVNEPLPDYSHIYGSKWYFEAVKVYGEPPAEIVEFAIEYQKQARDGINNAPYKDETQASLKEDSMPRAKKTIAENEESVSVKRTRKPKVAVESIAVSEETKTTTNVKRTRKPKVATTETAVVPPTVTAVTTVEKKQTAPRKRPTKSTESTPTNLANTLTHQEVVIPTHIERELEQVDTDDFIIEYIKLSPFEIGHTTYFRDTNKNKLYKKLRENGIGPYVGRWNPDTETIVDDIPDSDDEN
jgi:hypothetical protein